MHWNKSRSMCLGSSNSFCMIPSLNNLHPGSHWCHPVTVLQSWLGCPSPSTEEVLRSSQLVGCSQGALRWTSILWPMNPASRSNSLLRKESTCAMVPTCLRSFVDVMYSGCSALLSSANFLRQSEARYRELPEGLAKRKPLLSSTPTGPLFDISSSISSIICPVRRIGTLLPFFPHITAWCRPAHSFFSQRDRPANTSLFPSILRFWKSLTFIRSASPDLLLNITNWQSKAEESMLYGTAGFCVSCWIVAAHSLIFAVTYWCTFCTSLEIGRVVGLCHFRCSSVVKAALDTFWLHSKSHKSWKCVALAFISGSVRCKALLFKILAHRFKQCPSLRASEGVLYLPVSSLCPAKFFTACVMSLNLFGLIQSSNDRTEESSCLISCRSLAASLILQLTYW